MNEFFRKNLVALKRNTKMIPLIALAIAFLYFSLNMTAVSNTTAKIQAAGMGLCQFATTLFSLLSMVCMINAFPHRKKPNMAMVILLFIMIAIIIYSDFHYIGCIANAVNRPDSSIKITDSTRYIKNAESMLTIHIVLEFVSAALVALLPVYTKLIRKINTSVTVEDNGSMQEIDINE